MNPGIITILSYTDKLLHAVQCVWGRRLGRVNGMQCALACRQEGAVLRGWQMAREHSPERMPHGGGGGTTNALHHARGGALGSTRMAMRRALHGCMLPWWGGRARQRVYLTCRDAHAMALGAE